MPHIRRQTCSASDVALKPYIQHYKKKKKWYSILDAASWVCVDNPPVKMKTFANTDVKNRSRKLLLKMGWPYPVIRMHHHTVTINVRRLRNTVIIDRMTLKFAIKRTVKAATQATSTAGSSENKLFKDQLLVNSIISSKNARSTKPFSIERNAGKTGIKCADTDIRQKTTIKNQKHFLHTSQPVVTTTKRIQTRKWGY